MKRYFCILFFLLLSILTFNSCFSDESDEGGSCENIFEIINDPAAINEYLQGLSQTSDIALYEELGSSEDGSYTIGKLIISDDVSTEENEPEISIIGGIHGDEQVSVYIPLKLIQYIIENYGYDDAVTTLVDSYELHFIPAMNPWGVANSSRRNSNDVDLNRNFGWAWVEDDYNGEYAFDQAESRIIKDDAESNAYLLNMTFHSGEQCISTVWDYIGSDSSYGDPSTYTYETFVNEYMPNGETILSFADSYETDVNAAGDDAFYATEGFDWYAVYGSLGDWFYGNRGAVAYTIELSDKKSLGDDGSDSALEVWSWHKAALFNLFNMCEQRISGVVIDDDTGQGLSAKVEAVKISRSSYDPVCYNLYTYSDGDVGDFGIIADSATYSLIISADGYTTQSASFTVGSSASITVRMQKK